MVVDTKDDERERERIGRLILLWSYGGELELRRSIRSVPVVNLVKRSKILRVFSLVFVMMEVMLGK